MWEYEHVTGTTVAAQRVWESWRDVERWQEWNPDVVAASIDGPFDTGSTITMTLGDGGVIPLQLVDVVPGERFVDEATLDGVTVRTRHQIDAAPDGGSRVVYATTVSGEAPPEVLAEIGTGITADFPQTVAALLAHCAT